MDRDANGKFTKGNSASKGNKGGGRLPREREERYYEITLSTVTFDDWQAIVKKAAEQAKKGDAVARKWLSDYLVGAVQQRLELSGSLRMIEVDWDADSPDQG